MPSTNGMLFIFFCCGLVPALLPAGNSSSLPSSSNSSDGLAAQALINEDHNSWQCTEPKRCFALAIGDDHFEVDFEGAVKACRDIGGELASIHSKTELDLIQTMVEKKVTDRTDEWWHRVGFIGMKIERDPKIEDPNEAITSALWLDGSAFDLPNSDPRTATKGTYPWSYTEPNNADSVESCVELARYGDKLLFNDVKCDQQTHGGICQQLLVHLPSEKK